MANIITRDTGPTAVNRPLTNAEVDSNFININTELGTKLNSSEKGVDNGVAPLDANSKLPPANLPDIRTINGQSLVGSGNVAVEPPITAGTTTQYWRGDKSWRDFFADVRAATLTGLSTATNAVITATDTVLGAIGKLQAQVTGLASSKLDVAATSFNGNSATATKLQTARTITIGNTGKSFDGSANVAWSLAEIGTASETAPGFVELATTAEAQAGTDATRAVTPNGLAAYAGALSFRNKLINAAFTINQRGYTSGAATTSANQYTLDRWRVVTSGQALSWSGTTPNITITAPAGGVEQVIEGIWIEGGTYTLSWTGTATATVDGSAVANGGQVTLTAGANATVRFSGGTVSKPQLERGPYATQFEHRPYGLELALCQRYFEAVNFAGVYVGDLFPGTSGNARGAVVPFAVKKRTAPTVTFSPVSYTTAYSVNAGQVVVWSVGAASIYTGNSGGASSLAVAGPVGENYVTVGITNINVGAAANGLIAAGGSTVFASSEL